MQILQWLFKGAHKLERENTFSPATKREAIRDKNAKGENIIRLKRDRAYRRTKTIEGRSKLGFKNVKIPTFICTKDIAKSCFYSIVKLKRVEGSFNRRQHFVYSMNMKREELSPGVGTTNKADSAAHVGIKVLPLTEASMSISSAERNEQCGTKGNRDQIKGDKRKVISRMKELLRWAAAAKTERGGKFNGRKVLKFRRRGTLKEVPDDDDVSSCDSPKISFGWDVESCSTTSSVFSIISVASSSKTRQTQVAPSSISSPPEETDHIVCRRKGNWITTDSEFVVLEL